MRIERVKFILMVRDMDRAVAFWGNVVGLDVRSSSPWWSELAFGDAIVALHGGGPDEARETGLALQVADIEAACREVTAGGGSVRSEPETRPDEGIRLADLEDPEGNAFQLSEVVRKA